MLNNRSLLDRIQQALSVCRPFLEADGGDIELAQICDDGVVEISFLGACANCPISRMTLRAGIERTILNYAPEVKRIEAVLKKN
ncbi:MAG: NifU family protein [Bacteroidota bacterium]